MTEMIAKIGMTPTHPGEFVREELLAPLGLDVAKTARILDVRRATVSDLVNAKAAISPEMALRIEKAFGMNMETLLRMQALWDAHAMRAKAAAISVERYSPPAAEPR